MRSRALAGSLTITAAAMAVLAMAARAGGDGSDSTVGAGLRGADGETAPPIVDCESRIQVGNPGPLELHVRRNDLVAGPALFAAAKRWRKSPRKVFKPRRPGGLRTVKAAIILRADHQVTVTVSPPGRHRALLDVGLDQAPYDARGTSVTLRSCPVNAGVPGRPFGPWTTFLNGFKVDAPMCVGIEVQVEGAAEPIAKSIAFGERTRRTCPP